MTRQAVVSGCLLIALAGRALAICTANVGGTPRACPSPSSGRPRLPHHARRLRRAAHQGAQRLRRGLRHGRRAGGGPALPDGVRAQVRHRQPGGDRRARHAGRRRGHAPAVLLRGGAPVPGLDAALRHADPRAGLRRRRERAHRRHLRRSDAGERAARVLLPADRHPHRRQRADPERRALHDRDHRRPGGVQARSVARHRRRRHRRAPGRTLRERRRTTAPAGRVAQLPHRVLHPGRRAAGTDGGGRRARRLRGRALDPRSGEPDHHPGEGRDHAREGRPHAHPARRRGPAALP